MVAPTQTQTMTQRPQHTTEDLQGLTLMSDPRVVRGSTHSLYRDDTLPAAGSALDAVARRRPKRRRPKKQAPTVFEQAQVPVPSYQTLDLTPYLVEREASRSSAVCDTQTDGFLEQPPPAPYVPPKTGIDRETDMTESQPFEFSRDVGPLLDVLVEKTLEQALLEAEQEHELEGIQHAFDANMRAKAEEAAQVKAMEQAVMDQEAQKQAEFRFHEARLARERDLARKVGAKEFMAQNVPLIFDAAFDHFEARGAWPSPLEYEIKSEFLPSLTAAVAEQLQGEMNLAQKLLDDMLRGCVDACHYHPELAPRPPTPPAQAPAPAPGEDAGGDDAPGDHAPED